MKNSAPLTKPTISCSCCLSASCAALLLTASLTFSCAETKPSLIQTPAPAPVPQQLSTESTEAVAAEEPPPKELSAADLLAEAKQDLAKGRSADAREKLLKIGTDSTEIGDAKLFLGKIALQQKNIREAEILFSEACETGLSQEGIAGSAGANVSAEAGEALTALAASVKSDPKYAISCLQRLSSADSKSAVWPLKMAKVHFLAGHMAAARELASRVLLRSPDSSEAFAILALTASAQNKTGDALLFSERALELEPESAVANHARAAALILESPDGKRDGRAVEHLKKALKKAPESRGSWRLLGAISLRHRDYAEAEKAFRTLEQLDGKTPGLSLCLAWSIEFQKTPEGAQRAEEAAQLYLEASTTAEDSSGVDVRDGKDFTRIRTDALLGLAGLKAGILKSQREAAELYRQAIASMAPDDERKQAAEKNLNRITARLAAEAQAEQTTGESASAAP